MNDTRGMQRLRLQRFRMALATYAVVILAVLLVSELGLGRMTPLQWEIFLGIAVLGNVFFFALIRTNANLRLHDPSMTGEQIVYSAVWGLVPLYALQEARPIVLMFYLPAFTFGMLRLTRRQYVVVTSCVMAAYASVLVAEYLQKRPGFNSRYELFLLALFSLLLLWFAFFGGFVSNMRRRMRLQNEEIHRANEEIRKEMEERRAAQIEKDALILELREALARVKTLSGLLPICASCKRIRDDKGSWNQIETYVRQRSNAEFTHGICPECAKQLYPGVQPAGPDGK